MGTNDAPLLLGQDEFGDRFDGMIDEVRVYDRALTAGEVYADVQAAIGHPGH